MSTNCFLTDDFYSRMFTYKVFENSLSMNNINHPLSQTVRGKYCLCQLNVPWATKQILQATPWRQSIVNIGYRDYHGIDLHIVLISRPANKESLFCDSDNSIFISAHFQKPNFLLKLYVRMSNWMNEWITMNKILDIKD